MQDAQRLRPERYPMRQPVLCPRGRQRPPAAVEVEFIPSQATHLAPTLRCQQSKPDYCGDAQMFGIKRLPDPPDFVLAQYALPPMLDARPWDAMSGIGHDDFAVGGEREQV